MNQKLDKSVTKTTVVAPHLLQVHRNGLVEVNMRASVVEYEKLCFDVSRKQIETALCSMIVSDSRGSTPNVFVHSPVIVKVAKRGSEEAWTKILTRYQGTKVGIETAQAKSEGTLVGFRQEHYESQDKSEAGVHHHSKFFIISRSGSKVSFHPLESITALNFQDDAICEALSEDRFMKQYVVDRKNCYTIEVVAQGKGKGDVEVRYSIWSLYTPAYEVSYILAVDEDEDIFACGVRPDRNLKCYFTFHNPLQCHLSDVRIVFCSGQTRFDRTYWSYNNATQDKEAQEKEAQDKETQDKEAQDNHSVSERAGDDDHEERGNEEDEENFVDEFSDVSPTSTMMENYQDQGNVMHELPEKVSLKMNESTRVLMFETPCAGGIARTILTSTKDPFGNVSVVLHNNTNEKLEAGHLQVNSTCAVVSKLFNIIPLAPNEIVQRQLARYADIEWKRYGKVDFGNKSSFHVSENQLTVFSEKTKTMMGRIQNKSDSEVDILVMHQLRSGANWKDEVECFLTRGSWLHDSEGERMEPYAGSSGTRFVFYSLKLAPHETCWVTVREQLTAKHKQVNLEDLKSDEVAHLEVAQMLPSAALQLLRRLLSLRRETYLLKDERWLHGEKLREIEAYRISSGQETQAQAAENEKKEEGRKSAEDELQEYRERSSRASKARAVLEGLMDDIERSLFEVRREIASTRRQLDQLTA